MLSFPLSREAVVAAAAVLIEEGTSHTCRCCWSSEIFKPEVSESDLLNKLLMTVLPVFAASSGSRLRDEDLLASQSLLVCRTASSSPVAASSFARGIAAPFVLD
jgi:hypothetical protein